MLKRIMLTLIVLCCSSSIMSCGGGGGDKPDGGGSGINISISDFAGGGTASGKASSLSDVTSVSSNLSSPDTGRKINAFSISNSYYLLGTRFMDVNLTADMSTNNGTIYISASNGTSTYYPNDFTKFDNGLVGVISYEDKETLTPGNTGIDGISGNATEVEAVMLGGNDVNLQYSDFGYWAHLLVLQGKYPGQDFDTAFTTIAPFTLEADNAVKKAPDSRLFTGTVIAGAWQRSTNDLFNMAVSLAGTADLNLSTPTSGNLKFTFDNFYTLTTGVTVSSSTGRISPSGAFNISDGYKNSTGISLLSGQSSNLDGQFYGGTSGAYASEAVGTFGYSISGNSGIKGSFGVK